MASNLAISLRRRRRFWPGAGDAPRDEGTEGRVEDELLIRGSLRVLRDRTSLGTIAVTMREAGPPEEEEAAPGVLGRAWDRALQGTLEVMAAITVGLGYLLPILILLALLWLGFRVVRPRAEA